MKVKLVHLHIRIPLDVKKKLDYISKKYKIDKGSVIRIAICKLFSDVQDKDKQS
ncbi:MAG: hypothetical protein RMJ67_06000 [Elusimicrobiota bacterium]|nr:hypothetical protein [Endomicrobiia bacterium]MDW8166045.1 hypothetical protein [Elusimicrobiota bacterium]